MSGAPPRSGGLRPLLAQFLDSTADEQSGADLSRAVSAVLTVALVVTNLIGAAVVLGVIYPILPLPPIRDPGGRALLGELQSWLRDERPADGSVQRLVVPAPLFLFRLPIGLWLTAAIVFGALDFVQSARLGLVVGSAVALTGVTTGAFAYLVAERILRKPASRALADEDPGRLRVPGVATRAVLAWAFGSGVPVLGVVGVGIATLAGSPATEAQLERVSATTNAGLLEVGIGLNSGQVVAGNIGGAGRLEYGVIGDPVNVAARVQAYTRESGDALLLTQDTRQRLSAPPDGLRRRDGVSLRGRSQPIALYAL